MIAGLSISEGDLIADRYQLGSVIGEGGTGIIVAAMDRAQKKPVAIKFLRRALDTDELRTRFEREARAIAKIASEHVVGLLDVGTLEDGAAFMVMEHLDGRDLARILKEDGPLPIRDAVDCMVQVCHALGKAHGAGIVHRDLKPANVFLEDRKDGKIHAKIFDFGISKILDKKLLGGDGKGPEMTNAFTMLGSPRYMAPEQVRNSKEVDARADLWSVGAVLFQLITGNGYAFAAKNNVEASIMVLTADPQMLCALEPTAPTGLEEVIRRCLTRDVAARYPNRVRRASRPR